MSPYSLSSRRVSKLSRKRAPQLRTYDVHRAQLCEPNVNSILDKGPDDLLKSTRCIGVMLVDVLACMNTLMVRCTIVNPFMSFWKKTGQEAIVASTAAKL